MATQKQGASSPSDGGNARTALAAHFTLGAGWGSSTFEVTAGSTDKRGELVITCVAGAGLAQATATIVHAYDEWAAKPWAEVKCTNNNSLTAVHEFTVTQAATTTTACTWTSQIIPVDTKVYTVRYRYRD